MGFNIGVHSKEIQDNLDCYCFIDRVFYNFVNSGLIHGEDSILIKSASYYGLDLSPLTKLVYTWDEVSVEYINENIQKTEFLLDLCLTFKNKIQHDNTVCDHISYKWHDKIDFWTEKEIENVKKKVGEKVTTDFIAAMKNQQAEIDKNPNPWKSYFSEGQILTDLDNLIKRIRCYKNKGVEEIFLTAG